MLLPVSLLLEETVEHGGPTYVWLLKSFIMSKNLLYTSGWSWNWTLT